MVSRKFYSFDCREKFTARLGMKRGSCCVHHRTAKTA